MASAVCDKIMADTKKAMAVSFNEITVRFFSGLAQMIPAHAMTFGTAANAVRMSDSADESFIAVMQRFQMSVVDTTTVEELIRTENAALFETVLPQVAQQTTMAADLLPLCTAWTHISDASRRNVWGYLKRMTELAQIHAAAGKPLPDDVKADLAENVRRGEEFVARHLMEHGEPPTMKALAEYMRGDAR